MKRSLIPLVALLALSACSGAADQTPAPVATKGEAPAPSPTATFNDTINVEKVLDAEYGSQVVKVCDHGRAIYVLGSGGYRGGGALAVVVDARECRK